MKTVRTVLALAGLMALNLAHAQPWSSLPGGNIITTNEWLGAAAGSTVPLRIETRVNQPIDFYTDALHRMMLNNTVTTGSINAYTGLNQTGYFGLSDEPAFFNGSGPFSKIHLVEAMGSTNPVNYAQELGYRSWMRNGITMTGNSDQCYIGAKYRGDDFSDMVIQWSDNPGNWKGDRMRSIFTSAS